MALTNEQRSQLAAEAQKRGIDPAALIAAAEKQLGERPEPKSPATADAPTQDQPKLFMYLLPFVTVREVREKWLGLSDSFAGDSEVASKWAAKMGAPSGDQTPPDESA